MVKGFPQEGEIIDMGADLDIVLKSGSWYSYNEERVGQGRENAKLFLKENQDIAKEISQKIRDHYNLDGEHELPPEENEPEEHFELLD